MPDALRPAPLAAGDHVMVIAPSGSFARVRFERGLATLRDRYGVRLGDGLYEREGYLAASDTQRASDFCTALADPDVKAIVAARGGFGATRILPAVELAQIRAHPKWLVGFSDVTALHARWSAAGVMSLHAPMVCSLPEAPGDVQRRFFDMLEGEPPGVLNGEVWREGEARGPLRGGNLALLAALCGTPYALDLRGSVVLLEDVGERPYRLDRMLTTLRQSGCLDEVAGFALGQFSDCAAGDDGTTWQDAVRRNLLPLKVPIVADLRVGHVRDNHPLLLESHVHLDARLGELSYP